MKNSLFYFRNLSLVALLLLGCFQPGRIIAAELNLAPDCSNAIASSSTLWPVNHKLTDISINGVTDPDGDPLTIAVQCILQDEELNATGDGNFIYDAGGIDTATPSVRSERSGNNNGRVYHIDFIATDSKGGRCGGEVTVSVPHSKNKPAIDDGRLYKSVPSDNICGLHDINNAPWIYSDPVLTGATYAVYQYDVNGHDPDQDTLIYSILSGPGGLNIDPSSGILTWQTPEAGIFVIAVVVNDGRGGTGEQSYEVFINGPPEITSSPAPEHQTGNAYLYQVASRDPNNDILTYELVTAPQGMTIDPASGLISWPEPIAGEFPVAIQVIDGRGGSDRQEFFLFVNGPPVITSAPVAEHQTGTPYTYQVTAEDPNNDPLSYELAGPAGMIIDPLNGLVTWDNPVPGEYSVTIHVVDGRGGSDEQQYTLFVNGPPEITSSPVTEHLATMLYQYQVVAVDPNNDILTYSLVQAPAGVAIDSGTGLVTWTPTMEQVDTHLISVQVSDGHGGSDTQAWSVHVISPNSPPTITNTPPPRAAVGVLYQYPVLTEDPDDDPINHTLLESPAGMVINPATGIISWTPAEDQLGTVTLSILVDDNKGGTDTQTAQIEVIPDSMIDLVPVSLDLSGTTVDPQSLILTGPAKLTVLNAGEGYFEAGYEIILFEDVDQDNDYTSTDTVLGRYVVQQLHNGGERLTFTIDLNSRVAFRDNLVHAIVDSERRVVEIDEGNNHIHNQVDCTYVPPAGSFHPEIEWLWDGTNSPQPLVNRVVCTPVVANMNDDNGDGLVPCNNHNFG
jgi:hypothetical protein